MNKLFFTVTRCGLLGITLFTLLSACAEPRGAVIPPTANDALHAMRQHDDSIVQLKLQKCLRSNPFEGQAGNNARYDQYDCEVVVERYDTLLDQHFTQQQQILLDLRSDGWRAEWADTSH